MAHGGDAVGADEGHGEGRLAEGLLGRGPDVGREGEAAELKSAWVCEWRLVGRSSLGQQVTKRACFE